MTRYLFPLLLLIAVGCDSGASTETDTLADGRFTATVTGARTLELRGRAVALTKSDGWGLILGTLSGTNISVVVFDAPLGVGTLAVGRSLSEPASAALREFGDSAAFFDADGGALTVTSVADGIVEGSLSFTAATEAGDERVAVEAAFRATVLDPPTAGRTAPDRAGRRRQAAGRSATTAHAASAAGASASTSSVGP